MIFNHGRAMHSATTFQTSSNALINIDSLEIIEGDLPHRAQKLVLEWAMLYQQDLLQMWNTQEFRKLPPLK